MSVRRQCELLGIKRTTLYNKHIAPSAVKLEEMERLMSRIDYWHTEMPYAGSRRIAVKLREDGYAVGRKLVRRLMQEMALIAVYPKPNLSKRDPHSLIMPYLLKNMDIRYPNQVWSIDITYIRMGRKHMYLTAIIDWCSRRLMHWTLSDTLETRYVAQTVKEAINKHGVPAIINSDQGSQFTSDEYKALLRSYKIRQSMDGKSRWADNVMIERWFRSLKVELIYPNEFNNPRELRKAISAYVEQYNTVRPHESLDYQTPSAYYNSFFKAA